MTHLTKEDRLRIENMLNAGVSADKPDRIIADLFSDIRLISLNVYYNVHSNDKNTSKKENLFQILFSIISIISL